MDTKPESRENSFTTKGSLSALPCTIQIHSSEEILSDENIRKNDQKRLMWASIVCFVFIVAEVIGGVVSNSLAIATDAAHLLTDFGSFMVNLFAIYIAGKSRTKVMTFGFHRAETIGALVSVLSIWLITGILFYLALQRVLHGTFEIEGTAMLITATFGIFANVVLSVILLYKDICRKKSDNLIPKKRISLKSAFIHVVGDFVHSLGVLVASIIILLEPEYKMADPICTFIFSFIVLFSTFHIMKDIMQILMEGAPSHIVFNEINDILLSIPQVVRVHSLRMWSLSLDKVALSAHIVIEKGGNPAEVLQEATNKLKKEANMYEITLQLEEVEEPVKKEE